MGDTNMNQDIASGYTVHFWDNNGDYVGGSDYDTEERAEKEARNRLGMVCHGGVFTRTEVHWWASNKHSQDEMSKTLHYFEL